MDSLLLLGTHHFVQKIAIRLMTFWLRLFKYFILQGSLSYDHKIVFENFSVTMTGLVSESVYGLKCKMCFHTSTYLSSSFLMGHKASFIQVTVLKCHKKWLRLIFVKSQKPYILVDKLYIYMIL